MTDVTIPDGTYYLQPDGSCWIVAIFRRGQYAALSDEATQSTHDAACDWLAGLHPSDDDVEVDHEIGVAIIREVMGDDTIPEKVVVSRPAA